MSFAAPETQSTARAMKNVRIAKSAKPSKLDKHFSSLHEKNAVKNQNILSTLNSIREKIQYTKFVSKTKSLTADQQAKLSALMQEFKEILETLFSGIILDVLASLGNSFSGTGDAGVSGGTDPPCQPKNNVITSIINSLGMCIKHSLKILCPKALIMLVVICLSATIAQAVGLDWNVNSTYSIGNYDADTINPGNESRFTHAVYNLAEDISENNLVQYKVDMGSNQGVFYANSQDDKWLATIYDNYTIFTGNGEYISPNRDNTFYTYSSETENIGMGDVSAFAVGDGSGNIDFADGKQAWMAIPEPGTIMFASISFFSGIHLEVTVADYDELDIGRTFHVASCTNLASGAWTTNAPTYTITNEVSSVSITNNDTTCFFRLIEIED